MKFYFEGMLVSTPMLVHLWLLSTTVNGLYLVGRKNKPSITQINTDIIYVSQDHNELQTIRNRDTATVNASPTSSSNCGAGLLVCEVKDPTRLEAPWHSVSASFPQCYDPALYTCADNFLCPINAPKIPGQYACSPYSTTPTNPTLSGAGSAPSGSVSCGAGLLLCEVEDPTRLEAPWHSVYAAFPQCYDPRLYTCADNFLCPINAPKITDEYACGPYETLLPSSHTPIGSNMGTSLTTSPTSSSSLSASISSSIPTSLVYSSLLSRFTSGSNTNPFGGLSSAISRTNTSPFTGSTSVTGTPTGSLSLPSVSTILLTISTLPNGSPATIPGTIETILFTSASSMARSFTTIPPQTLTEPDGSVSTLPGTTEPVFLSATSSGAQSLATIQPPTSTGPDESIVTISGTTEPVSLSGSQLLTNILPTTSNTISETHIVIGGTTFAILTVPTAITEADGSTIVIGPSGIVIGTQTISLPAVTTAMAITSDGLTFTLEPGNSANAESTSASGSAISNSLPMSTTLGSSTSVQAPAITSSPPVTSGSAAVVALQPLASSVVSQYAQISASAIAWAAADSPEVAEAVTLESQFAAALSTATELGIALEFIELDTLSTEAATVVRNAIENTGQLRRLYKDLRRILNDTSQLLKTRASRIVQRYGQQAATGGIAFLTAFLALRPAASLSSSSSNTTSTSSTIPTPYFLATVEGTSLSEFNRLIKSLPDEGSGVQLIYNGVSSQGYITDLDDVKAAWVALLPEVDFILPNRLTNMELNAVIPSKKTQHRRALPAPPSNNIDFQVLPYPSPNHLRLVAEGPLYIDPFNRLERYLYDPIAGSGSTIYVLDTGVFAQSLDLTVWNNNPSKKSYIVPDRYFDSTATTNTLSDILNHGTCVASIALGTTYGVAKRATLIPVKVTHNGFGQFTTPAAFWAAYGWVIGDVNSKRDPNNPDGPVKAVINHSGGIHLSQLYEFEREPYTKLLRSVLQRAWNSGIVTVIASGNSGLSGDKLSDYIPQLIGRASNALITVGGVDADGTLWRETTPAGTNPYRNPGSISVYAQAEEVECANNDTSDSAVTLSGTSLAAPAVAGLAAYFLSLPNLQATLQAGGPASVAMNVKNYILQASYVRRFGTWPVSNLPYSPPVFPPSVAYNLASEPLCSAALPSNPKRAVILRQEVGSIQEEPLLSSGTLVATDFSLPPCTSKASSATSKSMEIRSTTSTESSMASPKGTSSIPVVPVVIMTFDAPATKPTCQQPGLQQYLTSQGVSLPSRAPFLDILLPIADQAGSWEVELGGPSNATDDITNWQVTQSGGPALNSGNGGASIFNWANSQAPTGTQLELEMAPDLGIVIFEVTLTGQVVCIPPTPTSVAASPTSPPETSPSPTGFFIAGITSSAGGSESIVVVPFAQMANCEDAAANEAEYTVIALDYSHGTFDPPELSASQLPSATDWIVAQQENNNGFSQVCGVSGLIIEFSSKGASGENILTWNDRRGTTGVCQSAVPSTEGCMSGGNIYTFTFELYCQANGNPSYCANETP